MDKELIRMLVGLLLFFTILFLAVTSTFNNSFELRFCIGADYFMEVIYEDNLIYDKCIVVEDGEEFTSRQWVKKHRYDGLEVRE